MKKSLIVCALLFSCASYAMFNFIVGWDEEGDRVSWNPYRQRTNMMDPAGFASGAKIEAKNYSSYVVTYVPRPKVCGLFNVFSDPITCLIESVIPGRNITLWENSLDSYDVIYRRDDGVVVAKNIETGKELYAIKVERTEGNGKEELLQSDKGILIVSNSDGTIKELSHKEIKNQVLSKNIRRRVCADKVDDDE